MSEASLRIWLPPEPEAAGPRGPLELEWLDEAGAPLAEPVPVNPPAPQAAETSAPDGELGWARGPAPFTATLEAPDGARAVQLRRGASVLGRYALEHAASPHPRPPDSALALGAAAGWRLAVVSERFEAVDDFFDRCRELFAFVMTQPPFGETGVRDRFGLVGLFWASDHVTGLFGATDDKVNGRLLYGDETTVKGFVRASNVRPKKTLVLINSALRAGAGGFDGARPSWSTITSAPGEQWQAIAVHELGHAFGLGDEYEDPNGATPEPHPLEPNISDDPDPRRCAWAAMNTVTVPPVPTVKHGAADPFPPGSIGAFEGARYRSTGRFRPAAACCMRSTASRFCPVCTGHIRRQLLAT